MSEIYKRIRERREALGMTQDELAKKMGYKSRSSINKIESGDNDIPQSKVEAFAKALETTTLYLMGYDVPMERDSESVLPPLALTEGNKKMGWEDNTGVIDMTTGERMKARRKELHIPIENIAAALGVSIATVYRYENGDIEKVPGAMLEPLSKVLRTTPAYLMGWEDNTAKNDHLAFLIQKAISSPTKGVVMGFGKNGQKIITLDPEAAQKLDEICKETENAGILLGLRQTEDAFIELDESEYETLKGMLEVIRKNKK